MGMERLVKMGTGGEYEGAKHVSPHSQPASPNLVFALLQRDRHPIEQLEALSLKHGAQTGQRTLTIYRQKDAV